MKLFISDDTHLILLGFKCFFYLLVHIVSRLGVVNGSLKPANLTSYKKNLMRHDSSKVAISNIVFKGDFMAFDKSIPGLPAAQFRFQILYKGGFGGVKKRPKYIWVICKSRYHEFNCLLNMNKQLDYVVYLNGSFVKMSNMTGSKRKLFWLAAQPQQATVERLDEVEKYSCLDCSEKPKVKLKLLEPLLENKLNRTLKCYLTSECKLVSYIFWYRRDKLIKDKENTNFHITSFKHTSLLTLINYTNWTIQRQYSTYKCVVVNVLGWKYSHQIEMPSGNITGHANASMKPRDEKMPCDTNDTCHNRGQCWFYPNTGDVFCSCKYGFIGQNCESKDSAISKELSEGGLEFGLFLFFGFVIIILIIVTIIFIIYCFRRLRQDVSKQLNSIVTVTAAREDIERSAMVGRDSRLLETDAENGKKRRKMMKKKIDDGDSDVVKIDRCIGDEDENEDSHMKSSSNVSTLIKVRPPLDNKDEDEHSQQSKAFCKSLNEEIDIPTDLHLTFKSSPQLSLNYITCPKTAKYMNLKSPTSVRKANGDTNGDRQLGTGASSTLPTTSTSTFIHYIIGTPKSTPRMTKH